MSKLRESFDRFKEVLLTGRSSEISVEEAPALTADEDLFLTGLKRVMDEYTELPRHAALRLGAVVTGRSPSVEIQVLKPCKRGQPRARTYFRGGSLLEAAHAAKLFVESILPCDDESAEDS